MCIKSLKRARSDSFGQWIGELWTYDACNMFGKTLSENDMKHKANAVNSPHTQKNEANAHWKIHTLHKKEERIHMNDENKSGFPRFPLVAAK